MKTFNKKQLKVYFIAGTQDLITGQTLPEVLEEAIQAGITTFQYREKGANSLQDPVAIKTLALELQALCRKHQVVFIINDDIDLALTIQADGIHVGQGDEAIQTVIKRCPADFIIGLSCYDEQEIKHAMTLPEIDYLGIGPVFATTSKADVKAPIGSKRLHQLARQTPQAIVAIGGLNTLNLTELNPLVIDGFAVISAVTQADNRLQAIHELKTSFQQKAE